MSYERSVLNGYAITWDVNTGKELSRFTGHNNQVYDIAFSPDGKWIATASQDHTAKIWDPTTGEEIMTNGVNGVAFSPDGKHVATAVGISNNSNDVNGDDIIIWNATTGGKLLTLSGHTDVVYGIAFSPDGTRIATASRDGTIRMWDATTGKNLLTLGGHAGTVDTVVFSPNGKLLASRSKDGTAKIWDALTGINLLTFPVGGDGVGGVSFSPDGMRLAINGGVGGIYVLPCQSRT